MKETRDLWGMPITVEAPEGESEAIFDYFEKIDKIFSTFKKDSEMTAVNEGRRDPENYSEEMKTVLRLGEETEKETEGYFSMHRGKIIDPLGLVKGWAIWEAAKKLQEKGVRRYFIEAGGDIQVGGIWTVGIRNPFDKSQIVRVLDLTDKGVATSGNYERGKHIINPHSGKAAEEIASLTVVADNVYEADRMATAAFAMGRAGINFIARRGLSGYMIDNEGRAVFTDNL